MEPSFKSMVRLFQRSGVRLSEVEYQLFWIYHKELRARNDDSDLTRIYNFENMVIKHYVDSAIVVDLISLPSPLLDIGSGAGFPGIPIKIRRPEIHLILAEGRKKRAAFLEDTCHILGLSGVEIYPHNVHGNFDMPVKGVITRALENISQTLERIEPFLSPESRVILMKGPNCQGEIEEALSYQGKSFKLEKDIAYTIPDTTHNRRLIVFSKIKGPLISAGEGLYHNDETRRISRDMRVKEIVSPNNDTFKTFVKITEAKGIKKFESAIFFGAKQVKEVLKSFPDKCRGMIFTEKQDLPIESGSIDMPLYKLTQELFREIDIIKTGYPLLIVDVPPLPEWDKATQDQGCTLCIPFQDPVNVGTVIRSAVAFGASRVVIMKEAAHPFHPKSVRAAGSALFKVPIFEGPFLAELQASNLPLIVLSPEGKDIADYKFPSGFCFVPGLEGPGVPAHLKNTTMLSIPMEPGVDSLNAALATGIALYLWRRRENIESLH